MNAVDALELSRTYEFPCYPKRNLVLVRGEGARVWDAQGREYIDCAAGVGVASIGHANPRLAEAIAAQARRLVTCPGTIDNEPRARLWAKLAEIAPPGLTRSFLCNSGTEAMEAALKLARLATGRTEFLAFVRGFHGRTMGSLSATYKSEYREPFQPLVPGFSHRPYNKRDGLDEAITERTAGVIVEVVQGEGGVHVGEAEFLHALRELCDARGALLIVDEIQTGFCRTGRWFASEHYGLRADLMCVAKGMGGGLPIGAVLCSDRIPAAIGQHGSTFGGNPLCCAAALAAIEEFAERKLAERAARLGEQLMSRIRAAELAAVREVRGLGLMIGVELKHKSKPAIEALQAEGVLALPAGTTVVRLLPPLVITEDELATAAEKLIAVLRRL